MKIIMRFFVAALLLLFTHQQSRAQSTPAQAFANVTIHHSCGTLNQEYIERDVN